MPLIYEVGSRVQICNARGMMEFRGKTGTVIGHERDGQIRLNRVELDQPVKIPGVGTVTDDLWASEYLKELDPYEDVQEGGEDDDNWDTNTKADRRRGLL